MATHVKVIAVLFLLIGAVLLLGAVFAPMLLGVLATIVGSSQEEDAAIGAAILGLTGMMASMVLLVLAVPYVVCGWGLLKLKPWSRVIGIILAALALMSFPLGTIFGVYALIILFKKETEALFAPALGQRPANS